MLLCYASRHNSTKSDDGRVGRRAPTSTKTTLKRALKATSLNVDITSTKSDDGRCYHTILYRRERRRARWLQGAQRHTPIYLSLSLSLYIYIYMCMYIYIYRERERRYNAQATPNLPTNIVGFKGFDSSIILIYR